MPQEKSYYCWFCHYEWNADEDPEKCPDCKDPNHFGDTAEFETFKNALCAIVGGLREVFNHA